MAGHRRTKIAKLAAAGFDVEALKPQFDARSAGTVRKGPRLGTGMKFAKKNAALSVSSAGAALVAPQESLPQGEEIVVPIRVPEQAVIEEAVADQAVRFKKLLELSLQHNIDIMEMELPPITDKQFGKILQIKQQIASSVVMATVRVNDTQLRGHGGDKMAELLQSVREESAALQNSGAKGGSPVNEVGDDGSGASEDFDEASLF